MVGILGDTDLRNDHTTYQSPPHLAIFVNVRNPSTNKLVNSAFCVTCLSVFSTPPPPSVPASAFGSRLYLVN